jgi:hypothetical protein
MPENQPELIAGWTCPYCDRWLPDWPVGTGQFEHCDPRPGPSGWKVYLGILAGAGLADISAKENDE